MLRHSLGGSIFFSLQHFIAPALDLMFCLQARGARDCNKGIKFKKGAAFNCLIKDHFVKGFYTKSTVNTKEVIY